MLPLASKTTPRETGVSSELKYLSSCSTPSSISRNASFDSPGKGAPSGPVTVTGTRVSLTSTRIAAAVAVLLREAMRGVICTRVSSAAHGMDAEHASAIPIAAPIRARFIEDLSEHYSSGQRLERPSIDEISGTKSYRTGKPLIC